MAVDSLFSCPRCGHDAGAWLAERTAEYRCPGCDRVYRYGDGVYDFVSSDEYVASFSFQWKTHARYYHGPAQREGTEATLRKLHITPELVRGKRVLDVGCGAGRFSEVMSRWGAEVVAIDLSMAVYAARQNLQDRAGVTFVHADLFKLPFPAAYFDVILAWGVLHHTPDTREAFRAVARHLKTEGTMAVYIYGRSKSPRVRVLSFYRGLTSRLPARLLYALCQIAGPMYYATKLPLIGNILRTLLPISRQPDWRLRVLETFDQYSPRYVWYHTFPEVQQWFVEAGMTETRVYDPPIYAVGRLPPAGSGPSTRRAA